MIKYSLYVCITIYIYGRICKFVCVQDLVQFEIAFHLCLRAMRETFIPQIKIRRKKNHTGLFSQLFFLRNKRPDVPKT